MTERQFYDVMRKRVLMTAKEAHRFLSAETSDGMMAPHVVVERIQKARKLARQINALADWMEAL